MNTDIKFTKKSAALTTGAAVVIAVSSFAFAAEHPHYMPPQISSYPSVKAPPSGQAPATDEGKEGHEGKTAAVWGYSDAD